MADEPSETHQFRARDGLYYDSYEKMRDANVRMNQLKLKEMGLDRYTKKENRRPSHLSSSSTTTGATPKRKKSLPAAATATDAPVEPLRRSERTPRQSSLWSPDPDELRPKKRTKSLTTEKQKKTTHKKKDEWDSPILEALRENLKEKAKLDKHWYAQFQQYWEPQISQQNYRTICRQVEKLISGKGISYHHWPNEVCFHKDKSIDMSMDLNSLYQLACSYEAEYGPDLGKGWLVRIPLSKLCIFQRYYLEQILYREANGGQDLPEARFPIGTQFEKEFPGFGTFKGKVKSFDGAHYHVVYPADGDSEDLTEEELSKLKILTRVPPKQSKPKMPQKTPKPAAVTAKPENTPSTAATNNNNGDPNPTQVQTAATTNNNQPRYPVGTVFAKVFPGHGCYVGRVTGFDGTFYKVFYSYDNDEEDFEEADFSNVTILKKGQGNDSL